MNIHCSACGAPLPQGAKFCPACALPLTAIAMPTPAPVKRPAPLWPWVALAVFVLFWLIPYTADHWHDGDAAPVAAAAPIPSIDHGLEERIEQKEWFTPRDLRRSRQRMAELLAEDQRRASTDPAAKSDVAYDQDTIARIDARLKELRAQ